MAITSIGYDGTIDEVAWAKLQKASASVYGVSTPESWKVTAVTGADRTVSIAPGSGWGHHVFDESNSNYTLQGAAISSGSRWDTVVLRRDWASNAGGPSAFRLNQGNANQALASRANDPGVRDDQPIALVQFTAGKTQPNAIIDLRTWASNGGAEIADKLALGYLGTPGAAVKLGGSLWNYELQGNGIWGWREHPLAKPMEHAEFVFAFQARSGILHGIDGGVVFDSARSINGGFASLPSGFLEVSSEGTYMVSLHVEWGGVANDASYLAILHPDGQTMASTNASTGAGATTVGGTGFYLKPGTTYPGNRLALRVVQHMGAVRSVKGRVRVTKIA